MTNITISSTPTMVGKQWVVYSLYDGRTAVIKYIGCCRLTDVFKIPDARANMTFDDHFKPDTPFMLHIISGFDNRAGAIAAQSKAISQYKRPVMNRYSAMTRHAFIKCVTTGEVFSNAQECCREHSLSQPALSNHLNGRPGYNAVKGRQYIRITPQQAKQEGQ